MPIKVLQIVSEMNLGGGARAVRTIYNYAPKDIEIHVVATNNKGPKYDEFKNICDRLFFANNDPGEVKRYVIANEISVIHFHGPGIFSPINLRIAKLLKPYAKILYTNIFGQYSPETDDLVDMYTFKSKHSLTQLFASQKPIDFQNFNFFKRYMVVPNPVDIKNFNSVRPSKKEIKEVKESLGIPNDHLVIGKVGSRKAVEKWSDLLLYMYPILKSKYPKVSMVLQGVPDIRLKWVSKLPDVITLPETNSDKELALYFNILDIFTHASKIGEHSGNGINEAEFWAKPVIFNLTPKKDNGQIEQLIDGKNGYFASTPKKYAEKVLELLNDKDKREKFGVESNKFIIKNNSAEIIVADYSSCFKFLATGEKPKLTISSKSIQKYANGGYSSILLSNLETEDMYSKFRYAVPRLYWKVRDYIDHNFSWL